MLKYISSVLDFVATYTMAALSGLWWVNNEPKYIIGIVFLLAYCYEIGYKKYFIKLKMKAYFIALFIAPSVLGVIGVIYGKFFINS
jgi:hypothetical protein